MVLPRSGGSEGEDGGGEQSGCGVADIVVEESCYKNVEGRPGLTVTSLTEGITPIFSIVVYIYAGVASALLKCSCDTSISFLQ